MDLRYGYKMWHSFVIFFYDIDVKLTLFNQDMA